MTPKAQQLYELLPAVYRIRDAGQGEPLKAFVSLFAEQVEIFEEQLSQSYDDVFIETCSDWVVPYIGDLIGYRPLHGVVPKVASPRADAAHTIAFRRRKGTAPMLEQMARDVTDWPARVVEFFQLLGTTQYMNHIRKNHAVTPDLRDWEALERLHTAFETVPHTVDLRRIQTGLGKYHVPNIGIFLWRLKDFSLTDSPAVPEGNNGRRFRFHPLGIDSPLFTKAEAEDDITHLAEPIHVPLPISRRVLDAYRDNYYGELLSLFLIVNGAPVDSSQIHSCDLSDLEEGGDWAHVPSLPAQNYIAVDPVLGRMAFPTDDPDRDVRARFHYGYSAKIGGGEYERTDMFDPDLPGNHTVLLGESIQEALDDATGGGVIQIGQQGDESSPSDRYVELLDITVEGASNAEEGRTLEVRSMNGGRSTIIASQQDPQDLLITGGPHSEVVLDGLLISGARIRVPAQQDNALRKLVLRHCTLVPGLRLHADSTPVHPTEPSLIVEIPNITIVIERCIVGSIQLHREARLEIQDSLLDATDPTLFAFSGPDPLPLSDPLAGGSLRVENTTIIGQVFAKDMPLVSNSILYAFTLLEDGGESEADEEVEDFALGEVSQTAPVRALQKQIGCVRFSYIPLDSQVPRRYRCQPDLAFQQAVISRERTGQMAFTDQQRQQLRRRIEGQYRPSFSSRRYGHPSYGQLRLSTPEGIRAGSDDDSEMGAFHHLFQPQREKNLNIRLEEYLRVSLEAGTFFST